MTAKTSATDDFGSPSFVLAYGTDPVAELITPAAAATLSVPAGRSGTPLTARAFRSPTPVHLLEGAGGWGLLAGTVFELEERLGDYPSHLPRPQRLARLVHDLYLRYGAELGKALDGMYVLAWATGPQLTLVRDAIGEHPLYLLESAGGVVAADRFAPLLIQPSCTRRLDAGAIFDYLATGFCPFQRTPVEGVVKLPPGTAWELDSRDRSVQRRSRPYHHLGPEGGALLEESDSVHRLRGALVAAVAKRHDPERPTALLLSGGLDSSLVGALLGGGSLRAALSISFGGEHRNEIPFSTAMARHLNVPHRVLSLSAEAVRDALPRTMGVLDEPIGDPLTVPNVLLAEAGAGEAEVIFNGEGGDPLFGGPKNQPMLLAEAFDPAPRGLAREERYLASYNKGYRSLQQLLDPGFLAQLRGSRSSAELLAPFLRYEPCGSLLSRLMYTNLRLKGAAQILPKVLKAASAAGVAVRSPLFDRTLAEIAFGLDPRLRLRRSVDKYLLKQAALGLVPPEIVQRPKSGMLVPVHFWFRRELRSFAHDTLTSRGVLDRGWFRRDELARLLRYRGGGVRERYGDRIWLLVSLELWLQAHRL